MDLIVEAVQSTTPRLRLAATPPHDEPSPRGAGRGTSARNRGRSQAARPDDGPPPPCARRGWLSRAPAPATARGGGRRA